MSCSSGCSKPTCLTFVTWHWCRQTCDSEQAPAQHAAHSAATWHGPTATYRPPFVHLGASPRTPVKAFKDIRLHLCCVVCFTEGVGGGVLKGDSTLKRGQTDGLCMGYLQPGGGDGGNLAVVAETRSQGSRRLKRHRNVIKSNISSVLGKAFVPMRTGKPSPLRSVTPWGVLVAHFINSSWRKKKSGLGAQSWEQIREPDFFFFLSFSPRDRRKEWTHRKDMFVLWWNASYLFLFLLTPLIVTSCSRDATANQNLPLCLVTGFKHSTKSTRAAKISTYSDRTLPQHWPTGKKGPFLG